MIFPWNFNAGFSARPVWVKTKVGDPWRSWEKTLPAQTSVMRFSTSQASLLWCNLRFRSWNLRSLRFEIITRSSGGQIPWKKSLLTSIFLGESGASASYHFTSLKMNGWNFEHVYLEKERSSIWSKPSEIWVPHDISGVYMRVNGFSLYIRIGPIRGPSPVIGRSTPWGVRCDKTTLPTCTHLFLLSTAMFLRSQLLRVLFALSTAKKPQEESCKLKCLLCCHAIIQRIPGIAQVFPPSHPTSNIRRKSHKI